MQPKNLISKSSSKVGTEKVKQLMWFHPKEPDLTLDSSLQEMCCSKTFLVFTMPHAEVFFHKDDINKTALDPDAVLSNINQHCTYPTNRKRHIRAATTGSLASKNLPVAIQCWQMIHIEKLPFHHCVISFTLLHQAGMLLAVVSQKFRCFDRP